ncbi:MAG TPA: peptide chain release factor-like protein, partial [Actinomycetota bacterium]|nr:peptide chain release factor-like protein [Actinomycetota bacterium]
SFASVDVTPEVEEDVEVDISPDDLRIDTYRSSGAGGQHVNVTDSAVRITHIPSGIVVAVQNERSQMQNRAVAMRILKSRLVAKAREEREAEMQALRGEKREIGFGSQIRSYVLHPYQMVKDHRTDQEVGNVHAVLDGELDRFIEAELKRKAVT